MNRQKKLWILDAAMAGGFLLTFFLDVTGLEAHQWLGIGVGAIAVIHLIAHWTWVQSVSRQFFGRASDRSRLLYLVDASVMAGLGLIVATGLVVSSWLSLPLASYGAWKNIHIVVSAATLMAVVLKIGLHWRWIVAVARRHIFLPDEVQPRALQPAPVVADSGRRDFLKLMGVVGAASVIAMGGALSGLGQSLADGSSSASAQAQTTSRTSSASQSQSASSTCRVRCGKRCSYPGHCRRYVDTNGNNRCDLGECM